MFLPNRTPCQLAFSSRFWKVPEGEKNWNRFRLSSDPAETISFLRPASGTEILVLHRLPRLPQPATTPGDVRAFTISGHLASRMRHSTATGPGESVPRLWYPQNSERGVFRRVTVQVNREWTPMHANGVGA